MVSCRLKLPVYLLTTGKVGDETVKRALSTPLKGDDGELLPDDSAVLLNSNAPSTVATSH